MNISGLQVGDILRNTITSESYLIGDVGSNYVTATRMVRIPENELSLWVKVSPEGRITRTVRTASFEGFAISLSDDQVARCSHRGDCYDDVRKVTDEIKEQFESINPLLIRKELQEHGAWSPLELNDFGKNQFRIVWIAANNIKDDDERGR